MVDSLKFLMYSSSQVKVRSNPDMTKWSPAHYILEVLSGSCLQLQPTSSIAYDMIMCLSENGVPDEVFVELLRKTIHAEARTLEQSSEPKRADILWDFIYSSQHVTRNRLQQDVSAETRQAQEKIAAGNFEIDPISRAPVSAQEQVLGWLQSGFSSTDSFVMDRLVSLQKDLMDETVKVGSVLFSCFKQYVCANFLYRITALSH